MKYRLQTKQHGTGHDWQNSDALRTTKAEAKADLLRHITQAQAEGWTTTQIEPDTEWVTLGKDDTIYHAAITIYIEETD